MKCILVKAGGKPEVIELKDKKVKLDQIKELLGLDGPVECPSRKIGKKYFDLWIDEEGWLKPEKDRVVSGVYVGKGGDEFLVGNILILRHDGRGGSIGLSQEDVQTVLNSFLNVEHYAKERNVPVDQDIILHGYFDNGAFTLKAHSKILMYTI